MKNIKKAPSHLTTTILAIICCILWGSAMPVLKVCYREMNITGSIMSAIFLPEEPILFVHVIGLILVSVGIIIVNRKNKVKEVLAKVL
ncbi:MAG TPA: hypothetical protein GX707_11910 [Epulopiscium sp.]|nr:hypothetical protein [Candidatus Epulonipiscium sp.]